MKIKIGWTLLGLGIILSLVYLVHDPNRALDGSYLSGPDAPYPKVFAEAYIDDVFKRVLGIGMLFVMQITGIYLLVTGYNDNKKSLDTSDSE
ncbi:hypothetical protein NHG25_01290 [Aerococcaceae bacterium NML191292]|nr:hypothetical protein [Aerococcaceae bacterium NML191292]MCW6661985.1 hypothetical protein [Aerococcaceae bacterium NML201209]MCW6662447.1 hypothetical protein [Aerococcaceae bacterium NML190073]